MSRYICIEGNIGAGKTTLAKALAKKMNSKLILEEFDENDFLRKFYETPSRYAFPLEMSFLADRYRQLLDVLAGSEDLFFNDVIADYSIYKSQLFAKNNLEAHEYNLYMEFYSLIAHRIRKPDLIIFLDRPISSVVKNIKKRGRDYEMNMEMSYLAGLKEKYAMLQKQYDQQKWLVLNADDYDFIENDKDIDIIIDQINELTTKRI